MGGWSDETKLMLNSTPVEIEVEVGVELGNIKIFKADKFGTCHKFSVSANFPVRYK